MYVPSSQVRLNGLYKEQKCWTVSYLLYWKGWQLHTTGRCNTLLCLQYDISEDKTELLESYAFLLLQRYLGNLSACLYLYIRSVRDWYWHYICSTESAHQPEGISTFYKKGRCIFLSQIIVKLRATGRVSKRPCWEKFCLHSGCSPLKIASFLTDLWFCRDHIIGWLNFSIMLLERAVISKKKKNPVQYSICNINFLTTNIYCHLKYIPNEIKIFFKGKVS